MPEEIPSPRDHSVTGHSAPRYGSVSHDDPDPFPVLAEWFGTGPFALILLFAAIGTDLAAMLTRARELYPRSKIAGCTTAGEICDEGYTDGRIVGIAFPASTFAAQTVVIDPIDTIESRVVVARLQRARQELLRQSEEFSHELAVLMVDGLSGREEHLIAALAGGLGPVPTIGGSAGDDRRFVATHVFADGQIHEQAAVLCLLRSKASLRTFSFDGTTPSRTQMVVTEADTRNRAILRINDEPAAQEYARLLGVPAESLGPMIFATRPVLVRAGGRHHVRSIQKVGANDALIFFGAVAEGMVLTLSEQSNIAAHLAGAMLDLWREGPPRMILGFDCIFRRMAAESVQQTGEISRILSDNRVAGFSTYGEQFGTMHVNQTFTGVAFYDTEPDR